MRRKLRRGQDSKNRQKLTARVCGRAVGWLRVVEVVEVVEVVVLIHPHSNEVGVTSGRAVFHVLLLSTCERREGREGGARGSATALFHFITSSLVGNRRTLQLAAAQLAFI